MSEKVVKVYVAEHCQPCRKIKEMIEQGQFSIDDEEGKIELIDIESEEGFKQITPELTGVPAAFLNKKQCRIQLDEELNLLRLMCNE